MWLLDANIDVRIPDVLNEFGIESRTAQSCGWKQLSNGELVAATASAGFTCLLTRDPRFAESAAKTLRRFPQFAIVIVGLKQERWLFYGDSFRKALLSPVKPIQGKAISWPR